MNKVKPDVYNVVSPTEATNIIETVALSAINTPDIVSNLPAIIFRGAPGIGKSSIVKQVATKLNIGFIDVRLAQLERCDFCGLPSVNDGVTTWNIPDFWPKDKNSAGILFFDELTSAPPDIQVAAYSMILDRKIPNTNYELPNKWIIVAAGNRSVDRAVVKSMSSALANRFMHFTLDINTEQWTAWALHNNIHPSVIGYINYRPANLFKMENENLEMGWPSPRSWERVSTMISLFGNNINTLRKIVYGLIGNTVGLEFIEYYNINSQFENILEMLTNPKAKIVIPDKADRKYALCAGVAYLLWAAETDEETNIRVDGFYRIINKLSNDFAVLLTKLCMQGNAKVSRMTAAMKLANHKEYKAFSKKYADALSEKYAI